MAAIILLVFMTCLIVVGALVVLAQKANLKAEERRREELGPPRDVTH